MDEDFRAILLDQALEEYDKLAADYKELHERYQKKQVRCGELIQALVEIKNEASQRQDLRVWEIADGALHK